MEIHYLGNSGFAIKHNDVLAIIDCYNASRMQNTLKPLIQAARTVISLSSHAHFDHYNKGILKWKEWGNVSYVLGFDIPLFEGAQSIHPGQTLNISGIKITAFNSTDAGVCFLIVWDGKSLFHAGDLNNWHWSEESTQAEIKTAERDFLNVLGDIQHLNGQIDIAMFPVDPRMGADYYKGAVQFIQAFRPKAFIPMHFGAKFDAPAEFYTQINNLTTVQTQLLTQTQPYIWA